MSNGKWYAAPNGQQVGPLELQQLQQMLASGQYPPTTSVWTDGMPNWTPANELPQFGGRPVAAPPPAPIGYSAPVGYSAPMGYQQPMAPGSVGDQSGKATGAMVLGILSLVLWLCPIVGLVLSIIAISMGKGVSNPAFKGRATAGLVMGIIGLILSLVNGVLGVLIRLSA